MNNLAKRETHAITTPRQEAAREITLRPTGDEDYRFQLRKLGNIHLGVKAKTAKGVEYPKATDYFVLPEALLTDEAFRAKLVSMHEDPDKPRRLPVMLLSHNIGDNLVTSCDLYGANGRLKCRTYDGKTCTRLNPKTFAYEECECKNNACGDAEKGDCAWYHRVRVLLPDAAGIGYWQVVTKSDNNRGALVREMMDIRNFRRGSLAGMDLMLVLTNEREFHIPMTKNGETKLCSTKPFLLHLESGHSLRELINAQATGEVYEADVIEESFTDDDMPVVEEDEFMAGEPVEANPETGEVVENMSLREECEQLLEYLRPGNDKLKQNTVTVCFKSAKTLEQCDDADLIRLRSYLGELAAKHNDETC